MPSTDKLTYEALTASEKRVYDHYKEDPYVLNTKLRLGISLNANELSWINMLDNLIKKYYSIEDKVLYRATCSDCIDGFIDKNGLYANPTFMSTATSLNDAIKHAKCFQGLTHIIMKLHCPSSTSMLPMDANPNAGHSEAEMLLNKNSVWQITEKRDITSPDKIQQVLGIFYGRGVKELTKYTMSFIRYNP